MRKPISGITKKRGRPATGKSPMLTFRSPPELMGAMDAAATADGLSRAEVIRRAVREWLMARGFLHRDG
jgi:hypothetical protein